MSLLRPQRQPFTYPAFPIRVDPEPSVLTTLLLVAWYVLAFSLAAAFHFFDNKGQLLEFMMTEREAPRGLAREFAVHLGGFLAGGLAYFALFSWLGVRRGLRWRQALHALAPGISGFLLFGAFVFHANAAFPRSPEAYLIARLPIAMALFWPFWRLKLLRGWTPGELAPGGRRLLAALALAFCALLVLDPTAHAVFKWRAWANNLPDMGLYVQMIWGFANGRMLHNTSYAKPHDSFLHGEHSLFSTALFTPLAWTPDPALALILAQAGLFVAAAWLVQRLARHYTSIPAMTWVFPILLLASPFVERSIIDDFHIDALEVLLYLVLWLVALGGFSAGRLVAFLAALVAYLGCKEDAGLTIGCMGFVMLFARRTRVYGAIAVVVGPATTLLLVKTISGLAGGSAHLGNYGAFGSTPAEIATTFFTRPDIVVGELLHPDRRFTIMRLAMSVGLLVVLAPEGIVLMGGAIVTTLLSAWDKQHRLETHYGLDFLAPLLVTALIGWRRLEALTAFVTSCPEHPSVAERAARERELIAAGTPPPAAEWSQHASEFAWRVMVFAGAVVGLALSASVEYAKSPAVRPLGWVAQVRVDPRRAGFGDEIAARIRPDDGVATQNHLGTLFAAREFVGWFPLPHGFRGPGGGFALDPRVSVILADARGEVGDPADLARWVREAVSDGGFGVEHAWEGFLLLRRGHEPDDPEEAARHVEEFVALLPLPR